MGNGTEMQTNTPVAPMVLASSPVKTTPKIFLQIPKVMADIEAIGKERLNSQQNFNFRGIDDVYNELHGHLAKHGVFTVPEVLSSERSERTTGSGAKLLYTVARIRFRFYADDGSYVDAVMIGEGMDSGDKSANKAMSVAHKYAFLQVFAIPTADDKDPDQESHQLASAPRSSPPVRPDSSKSDTSTASKSPAVGQPQGGPWEPSEKQLKRLYAISKNAGWTSDQVKHYMATEFNVDSSKKLSRDQYDRLCGAIEGKSA